MANRKVLAVVLAGLAAVGISMNVFADSSTINGGGPSEACNAYAGPYAGIQGGFGDTNWDKNSLAGLVSTVGPLAGQFRVKDSGIAGRVFAGYDINQYFAVEAGYTHFDTTDFNSPYGTDKVKTYGIDLSGKIKAPIADNFSVYAKAGLGYLHSNNAPEIQANSAGIAGTNSNVHNYNLVYGVGAAYQVLPNLIADVSMTRFNGNSDLSSSHYQPYADLYAVGVAYKFNVM